VTTTVPTADEFTALEARVSALEAGSVAPPETIDPPEPIIPPEPITDGVQAKRVANLVEKFWVNTFSSMDEHNAWGSWPADYRPASVIAALKYILGDSGFAIGIREYHYKGREASQRPWLTQVTAAIPGTRVTLCPGANASTDDVPSMIALANDPECNVRYVEGLNEGNTDFGSGNVPPATQLAIQQAVWNSKPANCTVMGPSVVAGTPHPEGWVTGYCGDTLPALNAAMEWGNGHYYPPKAPDVPNTGYSVNEYIGGLWGAYAQHPIALTEFHPTLYASGTYAVKANIAFLAGRLAGQRSPPKIEPFTVNSRDPFFTLTTLLRAGKNGTMLVIWYALFDYGSTYQCGLFPKDQNNPRPTATALNNLFMICADHGSDLRTFAPGKLDITVDGLAAAMDFDVYQASNGRFLIPIWHAAEDVNQGVAVQVNVRFDTAKGSVSVFDPLTGKGAIDHAAAVREITVDLPPGVVVLEVNP